MGVIGICCEVCWERKCNCTEEDRKAYRERHKNDPPPIFMTRTKEENEELSKELSSIFMAGVNKVLEEIKKYKKNEREK